MTGRVIQFPQHRQHGVRIEREDEAWIVSYRSHGWLHGSRREALAEAAEIAAGFNVGVIDLIGEVG